MKKIAVIFGSRSAEHDISIITAISAVIKPLEATGNYKVEPIYIDKSGRWFWDEKLKDISLYQSGEINDFCDKAPQVQLQFGEGLTLVKSSQFAGRKKYQKIDIVFPATHGTYGEDGSLMGLLEMANVPYVGCGLEASAIAMDKVTSKLLAEAHKVLTPTMQFFTAREYAQHHDTWLKEIQKKLSYPLFVKPSSLGSSIGISRVENERELINAIEVALRYDDKVLVEEAVQNLVEVTLPIVGNADESLTLGSVEQPLSKEDGVFDFDTKYLNQGKSGKKMGAKTGAQGYSKIPAVLPEKLIASAQEVGVTVYRALGCEGIARIDMLVDTKAGIVYFNEINPLPGSLYRHNWAASGISSIELVEKLLQLAESRWRRKQSLTTTFDTNFLKQF